MTFTKNFDSDPLGERVHILVYGTEGVGKTHLILDLVRKHGDYVILFSLDKGTMAVRQEARQAKAEGRKSVFQGKLMITYADTLQELRKDMKDAVTTVGRLARNGVPRSKIWVVIDTATHLQGKLLAEARKINVKNPDAKDSRNEYVRDAIVEMDWGINLAHMSEVADFLNHVKANVAVIALSKKEKVKREETGRVIPAISGQSAQRFQGDTDAILHLVKRKNGARIIEVESNTALTKDRSGLLDAEEPADLKHIQQKSIGTSEPAALPASVDEAPNESEASAAMTPAPQN